MHDSKAHHLIWFICIIKYIKIRKIVIKVYKKRIYIAKNDLLIFVLFLGVFNRKKEPFLPIDVFVVLNLTNDITVIRLINAP